MFSLFFYCAEETKYTVKIKADVIAKQQITVAFAHTQKKHVSLSTGAKYVEN
jgi:hypothetical protein